MVHHCLPASLCQTCWPPAGPENIFLFSNFLFSAHNSVSWFSSLQEHWNIWNNVQDKASQAWHICHDNQGQKIMSPSRRGRRAAVFPLYYRFCPLSPMISWNFPQWDCLLSLLFLDTCPALQNYVVFFWQGSFWCRNLWGQRMTLRDLDGAIRGE